MAPFRVRQARSPRRWESNYSLIVLVGLLLVAGYRGSSGSPQAGPTPVHFVPNSACLLNDRRTGPPVTARLTPIFSWLRLFRTLPGRSVRAVLLLGAEFRHGRSLLPTDRRRQVRELPVFRYSLRHLFRRYQRDSEQFGLQRHHRAVWRRRQACGALNRHGLPIGEPGHVDTERETFSPSVSIVSPPTVSDRPVAAPRPMPVA